MVGLPQTIILVGESQRHYARRLIGAVPRGCSVTIEAARRTVDQNAKMWAMLADVAKARPQKRDWETNTWKAAFMHALGHKVIFAEGLDGSGPFPVGFSTRKLKVAQMADLIESIYAYGAEHGVVWSEKVKNWPGEEA